MIGEGGILKFEFFLKIYKASMMWNKILFLDTKKGMMEERREMMKNHTSAKAPDGYKTLCVQQKALDEKVLQDVIDAIFTRIGYENEEFQKTLMKYMGDPSFLQQIQKARSDNEEGNFDPELMPKHLTNIFETESSKICSKQTVTEAIKVQKKLQELSIAHMKELKKLPLTELNPEL